MNLVVMEFNLEAVVFKSFSLYYNHMPVRMSISLIRFVRVTAG